MIDGYKFEDGKVIVVDYDKYNTKYERKMEYRDNIEELLMAWNIKEYLLDLQNKTNASIGNNKQLIKKWKEERTCRIVVMFMSTLLLSYLLSLINPVLFGGTILVMSVITIKIVYNCVKMIKKLQKEIAGASLTLEGIEEQLEKNKIELRRLENDNSVECENIKVRNYTQLNNVDELKRLRDYLELWCIVGENEKEFSKYEKYNKMYSKLDENFSVAEIKTLRRILNRNQKRY